MRSFCSWILGFLAGLGSGREVSPDDEPLWNRKRPDPTSPLKENNAQCNYKGKSSISRRTPLFCFLALIQHS